MEEEGPITEIPFSLEPNFNESFPTRLLASPDDYTDSDSGSSKTRTFVNGDVVVWADFSNQWERTVTFLNTSVFEYVEQVGD